MKVFFAFPLLACTARAFVVPTTTVPMSARLSTHLNMYDSVEAAIDDAQRICAEDPSSMECKVAWDIVEELEAADSHQLRQSGVDASQSMDYLALMGSFDILTEKIDGKMDQLIATATKLDSMGADPSFQDLARLADEMKQALAYVKSTLPQR